MPERFVHVLSVTNGRASSVHRVERTDGILHRLTLCGRPVAGSLNLSAMLPSSRSGWLAASQGPCQRCSARASRSG